MKLKDLRDIAIGVSEAYRSPGITYEYEEYYGPVYNKGRCAA